MSCKSGKKTSTKQRETRMKISIWMILALVMALSTGFADEAKGKYAVILQAGNETNEGMARAVHALLYTQELAEHGHQVVLIFDGAGTGWAKELRNPENPFHQHYNKIQKLGMVVEICDYCAAAFEVKEDLPEQQKKLLIGDYNGHVSISKWADKGYEIIVL
jgi:hypothetical protein